MSDNKREMFEEILVLRKEQEMIGDKIAQLHRAIVEEDLHEMGLNL